MSSKLSNEFKSVMKVKFKTLHFIISLSLMAVLIFGISILSFILGWLCCMEPASSLNMFSNLTVFGIFTIDLLVLLLVLIWVYKSAKVKGRIGYCKSYLIMGFILIIVYLVIMSLSLMSNIKLI